MSPRAYPMILAKAYRPLAAYYHPDNKLTGDGERFKREAEAYRFLADPVQRAVYDRQHPAAGGPGSASAAAITGAALAPPARSTVEEREVRHLILWALYDARRGRSYKPRLSLLVLAELAGSTIEDLQFSLWYLRGKRLIEMVEDSDRLITVEGVDQLEGGGGGRERGGTGFGGSPGRSRSRLHPTDPRRRRPEPAAPGEPVADLADRAEVPPAATSQHFMLSCCRVRAPLDAEDRIRDAAA